MPRSARLPGLPSPECRFLLWPLRQAPVYIWSPRYSPWKALGPWHCSPWNNRGWGLFLLEPWTGPMHCSRFLYLPARMGDAFRPLPTARSEVSIALRPRSCGRCQAGKERDGLGCRAVTAAIHFLV